LSSSHIPHRERQCLVYGIASGNRRLSDQKAAVTEDDTGTLDHRHWHLPLLCGGRTSGFIGDVRTN
jgi:hypothetical protein